MVTVGRMERRRGPSTAQGLPRETVSLMSTPIDFAIVTALTIERDAVLRRLEKVSRIEEPGDPYVYYRGELPIVGSSESYQIVVIRLLEPGNVNSGVETTELLKRWRPQYVLLAGIAGGFPEKH